MKNTPHKITFSGNNYDSFKPVGNVWKFSTPEDANQCQVILDQVVKEQLDYRMEQIRQAVINIEQRFIPDHHTYKKITKEAPSDHKIFGIMFMIEEIYKILDNYENS